MIANLLVITFFATSFAWPSEDEPVNCYHGESQNNKSSTIVMKCPSNICIRFSAVCNSYFASTCYNEADPMSLLKNFTMAMKHYKNDPESAMFEACRWSKCNSFDNIDSIFAISKPPTSFDQFLSTKVPKEKLYRELQNKMWYFVTRQENETFRPIFETFKTAKQAWISLDLMMKDNSTVRRKFIFDFVNGKVKLSKWIQHSNLTKPGGLLNFTIEYTTVGTKIFINDQFFQALDKKVKDIIYLTYGGEMSYSYGTSIKMEYEYNLGSFSPEFYSTLIPAKKPISTKIVNLPKLNVTSVNWEPDTSYILIPIIPLKSHEKLNFEFRTDYQANSDLAKVQVQAISPNTTSNVINYHVFMWYRADNLWTTYGKLVIKNCKKPNLFLTLGYVSFYCDNSSKFSMSIFGDLINAEFKNFYSNAKVQKFTCLK